MVLVLSLVLFGCTEPTPAADNNKPINNIPVVDVNVTLDKNQASVVAPLSDSDLVIGNEGADPSVDVADITPPEPAP